jgi:hypothetical protein
VRSEASLQLFGDRVPSRAHSTAERRPVKALVFERF